MPTQTRLAYSPDPAALIDTKTLVVVGRRAALRSRVIRDLVPVSEETWDAMLARTEPGDRGSSASTWVGDRKVVVGVLPEVCSRHMSPSRAWAIPALVRQSGRGNVGVLVALTDPAHAFASVLAVARAYPLYDHRSGELRERTATVCAVGPEGPVSEDRLEPAMQAVRLAARLMDMPTSELHTDAFVEEARLVARNTEAEFTIIRGTELREAGFGALWGVGKAAVHPPALVALTHRPPGATRKVVWVGKGIVYDTGGLSIKGKSHMPGMKGDMGGAAAVLAAFQAAVATGFPHQLTAVLCLAENSVGPESMRPDDILTLYSGKTVEVNNTDAEGRLVLADGVAWACKQLQPDLLIDMATLTGAALMSGGKVHACIYTNSERCESAAIAAGKRSGEVVHPLLYAPELHRQQFRSPVADMKNSVKDRMNAQCSCAAQFIANHLPENPPTWLHIDIAGTAWNANDRGTGFGVGLLLELGAGPES
jgi:probable aminopeptidase NPEPL1